MPSTMPPLGVRSFGPRAIGSSIPAIRPAKAVQAPLYNGPSPTLGRPNIPCGTCFSPARNVLLVPSVMVWRVVLLRNDVTSSDCAELVATDGVGVPMMIAPLLLVLNQFWAFGSFGLPRMSP